MDINIFIQTQNISVVKIIAHKMHDKIINSLKIPKNKISIYYIV